jgi:uncharacterized membrane protein (DUF106 family)
MSKIKAPDKIEQLPLAIIQNMIALATSGFGLVVALAWNELIRTSITHYLTPILGVGGGIISLLVYAIAVTVLAVLVTMQLSKIEKRLKKTCEDENDTKK